MTPVQLLWSNRVTHDEGNDFGIELPDFRVRFFALSLVMPITQHPPLKEPLRNTYEFIGWRIQIPIC